ncbi:MAG: DUF3667 domain-containing protein [Bacteroidota bacterium]
MRSTHNCLNCGTPLHGKFCANCGQRASTQRFTFRRIFSTDFISDTFNLNQGLMRTFRDLTFRPGYLIRDYLGGKRKRYFNFIGLLLILLAIEALLWSFAHNAPADVLLESMRNQLAASSPEMAENLRTEDIQRMNSQKIIFPFVIPLAAIGPFLFLRRLRLNYAECCIVIVFLLSMNTLLGTIISVLGLFPLSFSLYKNLYNSLSIVVLGFGLLLFWQLSRAAAYSRLGRIWRVLATWLTVMAVIGLSMQFIIGGFQGYRQAAAVDKSSQEVVIPRDVSGN